VRNLIGFLGCCYNLARCARLSFFFAHPHCAVPRCAADLLAEIREDAPPVLALHFCELRGDTAKSKCSSNPRVLIPVYGTESSMECADQEAKTFRKSFPLAFKTAIGFASQILSAYAHSQILGLADPNAPTGNRTRPASLGSSNPNR
jgi:hypothetical protein